MEIHAMPVTDNRAGSATILSELLLRIPGAAKLVTVTTDGMCGICSCPAAITVRGATETIPPRRGMAGSAKEIYTAVRLETGRHAW